MGNTHAVTRINFEDMQVIQKRPNVFIIINTLPNADQGCLITHTISVEHEEEIINELLKKRDMNKPIVVYGKHCSDGEVEPKCKQLLGLGFRNINVYTGGLFEWILLQNIYDIALFPTTKCEIDLLKYKPRSALLLAGPGSLITDN